MVAVVLPPDAAMVPGAAETELLSALAGPAVAVAVKVTGLPETPAASTVACKAFGPALLPSVQLPTVAMPSVPVDAVPAVTLPPPLVTANVTATLATGVPPASRTITAGRTGTAVPAGAVCPVPAAAATAAGAPTPIEIGVLVAGA